MKKITSAKQASPVLQVYISDKNWPNMELLIISDTGKEYSSVSMYDIAHSQFAVQIQNALQDNLRVCIDIARVKAAK